MSLHARHHGGKHALWFVNELLNGWFTTNWRKLSLPRLAGVHSMWTAWCPSDDQQERNFTDMTHDICPTDVAT